MNADPVFAFQPAKVKETGTGRRGRAGRAELCHLRGHLNPCQKPSCWSHPGASLLRNSLKEIVRFTHSNVLESRQKHPSGVHRKSDKEHHRNTEQRWPQNQPHGRGLRSRLRPDFAQKAIPWRKGWAGWLQALRFSAQHNKPKKGGRADPDWAPNRKASVRGRASPTWQPPENHRVPHRPGCS